MPWFSKDAKVPDEIKDLTPEQLAEAVKKKVELEAQLSDFAAKSAEKDASLKMLQAQVAQLEAATRAAASLDKISADKLEEDDDILTNPSGVIDKRVAPIAAAAMHAGVLAARMSAENEIFRDVRERALYLKYKKEIDELADKYTPDQRILPQTYHNLFIYVKGKHEKEISAAASSGDEGFFSEGVSSRAHEKKSAVDIDKLTDQEIRVAARMRVTPEEYLKNKKQMQVKEGNITANV